MEVRHVMSSVGRWIRPSVGFGLSGIFLWLLLRQLDLEAVVLTLSRMPLAALAMALTFLAVDYALRIIRWWWMLRILCPSLPLRACGWPLLTGTAVNNLLPLRAGDALRIVGFCSQLHSPPMSILGTVFIERLLDLTTLLAFFFAGLTTIAHGQVPETVIWSAYSVAIATLLVLWAVMFFSQHIERFYRWISELPALTRHGWAEPVKRHGENLLTTLRLLQTPASVLQLIALSIAVWIFEGAVFAVIADAMTPLSTPGGAWFTMALASLATLLPSSPGYVGTFDFFAMLGLRTCGAEPSAAAAFALAVHAVLWLPLTVLGLAYLLITARTGALGEVGSSIFRQRGEM